MELTDTLAFIFLFTLDQIHSRELGFKPWRNIPTPAPEVKWEAVPETPQDVDSVSFFEPPKDPSPPQIPRGPRVLILAPTEPSNDGGHVILTTVGGTDRRSTPREHQFIFHKHKFPEAHWRPVTDSQVIWT